MFTRMLLGLCLRLYVALCLTLCAGVVSAQVQVDLLSDGALIIGVVSNADGTPAAETAVQIAHAAQPSGSVADLQTDTVGIFTYTGDYETTYRVTAGSATAEITLGEAPPEAFTWPPIYITLGILMLLSLIPARMLRRKDL